MLRWLTCATVIFALVLSLCLLPHTVLARRCGEKEPETLLSLYQNSDDIYIATFDKLIEGEVVEDTDDYTAIGIKKHFTISSTLKGESRKFFVLQENEYRYKEAAFEPLAAAGPEEEAEAETDQPEAASSKEDGDEEVTAEVEEAFEDQAKLKSGDTLLLFVAKGTEGEPDTLADYRDGIKKLSMQEIGVYESRINELNSIFSAKKVSAERLIAWLIRCAEDPVTRWEGTYELLRSVQSEEWRKQAADLRAQRIARGEPVEEEPAFEEETDEGETGEDGEEAAHKEFDTSVFAKMLDTNHKQTLANILLNSYTGTGDTGKARLVPGDSELIELVKRWGDPRLVGFLLDRLRAGGEDHWLNVSTMQTIAEVLDDSRARKIADEYSENAYQEDDDAVEPEGNEVSETKPAPESDDPAEPETAEPVQPEDNTEEKTAVPEEEPKRLTFRELRTELLQKFIARCERVIAGDQIEIAENLTPQDN